MDWKRSIRSSALVPGTLLLAAACALHLAPAFAADPGKTLRVVFSMAETSFDPQFASDAASDGVIANIYEAMLDYDYLARPVKLVPRTLEAMPTVLDGGKTYLFKIRKGIFFTPDPAFKGKPRELTAADQVYGLKRLLDPAIKSPWAWLIDGKVVGAEEARAKAAKTGKLDYDAPFPGIEAVDRYTLRIRLKDPDLRFLYALAVPNTTAVAREVVEAYGLDFGAHPVGTGPYLLGEYKRSSKIVLTANPAYREETYTPGGSDSARIAADRRRAERASASRSPGRIEISVIEEGQAHGSPSSIAKSTCSSGCRRSSSTRRSRTASSRPDLAAKGIQHEILLRPNTWWTYFDMENPVVGGYTPERIALRRAIGMAYDQNEAIRVLLKGRAVPAISPIPPDIAGYDPALKTNAQMFDPAAARALLDRFGYKDRDGDGYRETPDGKPLAIECWSTPNSVTRQGDELWKKNMDAIGIRLVFKKDRTPELRKMARLGKIPMRSDGWNADYPDAENFMQLLYGPNAGQENNANFKLAAYDKLFDESRRLPDSPARTQLFNKMTELVLAYAPWRLGYHLIEDQLLQPWVRDYKPHPIRSQTWQYVDIDAAKRP